MLNYCMHAILYSNKLMCKPKVITYISHDLRLAMYIICCTQNKFAIVTININTQGEGPRKNYLHLIKYNVT